MNERTFAEAAAALFRMFQSIVFITHPSAVHGRARQEYASDQHAPLTPEGSRQAEAIGDALTTMITAGGVAIASSHFARAMQLAGTLAQINGPMRLHVIPPLFPAAWFDRAYKKLKRAPAGSYIAELDPTILENQLNQVLQQLLMSLRAEQGEGRTVLIIVGHGSWLMLLAHALASMVDDMDAPQLRRLRFCPPGYGTIIKLSIREGEMPPQVIICPPFA